MLSLEEFKKLMPTDREYSEEEIMKLRENMEIEVEIYFNMWFKDRN